MLKKYNSTIARKLIPFQPQGSHPKSCSGKDFQSFPCNTQPCDMKWSNWTDCSATCGRGIERATTLCQPNEGKDRYSIATYSDGYFCFDKALFM